MGKRIKISLAILAVFLLLASGCISNDGSSVKNKVLSEEKHVRLNIVAGNSSESVKSIAIKFSSNARQIKSIKLPDGNVIAGNDISNKETKVIGTAFVFMKTEDGNTTLGIFWKNEAIKGNFVLADMVIIGTENVPEIILAQGRNSERKVIDLTIKKV